MTTPVRDSVLTLLQQNTRSHEQYTYTVPSPSSYPYQWLWDSCWHAILWNHFDSDRATAELRSLIAHQHANGLIGHVTYWKPSTVLAVDWGLPHTSSLLQPPIIAYALWRIYDETDNVSVLSEFYPALQSFYTYILRERNVRHVGLYGLVNPDESGEDNAPRFDTALRLPPHHDAQENTERRYELFTTHRDCKFNAHCTSRSFWVEDLAFNVYLYWNLTYLADIAALLGKTKDRNHWDSVARDLKGAMRTHMFRAGAFRTLTGPHGIPTADDSWTQFLPLLAGLYSQAEADELITTKLQDPELFWLPTGIPTVAPTDPGYAPDEPRWGDPWQHPDWRGAIWMVPHWCIYHGLRRYGHHDAAEHVRTTATTLVTTNGWRENFHPQTGTGQGAQDFTWGGLVIDMQ